MTARSVIVVENLSKHYFIGQRPSMNGRYRYVALRDVIQRQVKSFGRKAADVIRGRPIQQGDEIEEFWALKNISFEIKEGERVGIVGRNGAGKSTLLKVLSRITEPTTGRLLLRGRIASLLEVGTGFHPELTGRENIYLNGAILGMMRHEIRRKFDEIVAFAEIDKFLETPVKHYSSGMYVRLAFAVAAHLEPDVLVVDEVLAVGDAQFQKKCLGKMEDVSRKEGKTVLFVSHNLTAISALCDRAMLLEQGSLVKSGGVNEVLEIYYRRIKDASEDIRVSTPDLRWCGLLNRKALDGLRNDQDINFEMAFETGAEAIEGLHVDCELVDEHERRVIHCKSRFVRDSFSLPPNTRFVVRYVVRSPRLAPGHFRMIIYAATGLRELCWVENIDACRISAASPFSSSAMLDDIKGATVPDFEVEILPEYMGGSVENIYPSDFVAADV
jgi:ABC-type polysaccharide/polyol phosphate transport system ATPase subunit